MVVVGGVAAATSFGAGFDIPEAMAFVGFSSLMLVSTYGLVRLVQAVFGARAHGGLGSFTSERPLLIGFLASNGRDSASGGWG